MTFPKVEGEGGNRTRMTCGRANRYLRRNRTAASRSRMANLQYTRSPCPVPLVLPIELLRHKIEGACLFHAVTRYAGIAASSFRRWAAFAVRLPCPQGPHGGLTAHGFRAAFTCTPRRTVLMLQIYGPVWTAPVKLEAPQPDSPSGNAVPAAPELHSEAAKLLHTSIARDRA